MIKVRCRAVNVSCPKLYRGFPGRSVVKNPPAMQETQETWVWSLGQEDPLETEMTVYSSILAWEIPWTEEPGRLQSVGGSQRVRHNLATKQQHNKVLQTSNGIFRIKPRLLSKNPNYLISKHPVGSQFSPIKNPFGFSGSLSLPPSISQECQCYHPT